MSPGSRTNPRWWGTGVSTVFPPQTPASGNGPRAGHVVRRRAAAAAAEGSLGIALPSRCTNKQPRLRRQKCRAWRPPRRARIDLGPEPISAVASQESLNVKLPLPLLKPVFF